MKPSETNARHLLLPVVFALALAGCVDPRGTQSVVQTGPTTLQAVQTTIFSTRCATSGCHVAGAPFGLDLRNGMTAGNTIGVPSAELQGFNRVTPFDAANSYLYMKIVGDTRINGDQMPSPQQPPLLTAAQMQLVADWIDAGALE